SRPGSPGPLLGSGPRLRLAASAAGLRQLGGVAEGAGHPRIRMESGQRHRRPPGPGAPRLLPEGAGGEVGQEPDAPRPQPRRRPGHADRGAPPPERGYAGTSIEAIAGAAGVAAVTVYSAFGSKRALLARLIGVAVVGDERPVPLLERPGPRRVMATTDQRTQVRLFARDVARVVER